MAARITFAFKENYSDRKFYEGKIKEPVNLATEVFAEKLRNKKNSLAVPGAKGKLARNNTMASDRASTKKL